MHWMTKMPDDTETLIAGLRAWTREHDSHVRAAVELLIWHGGSGYWLRRADGGYWLRRADFTSAAVHRGRHEATIDWDAAREFVDQGPRASTSEMAVLDLAVALGENRYRLSIMDSANSQAIVDAVRQAVGL
jgi:hypothetical protein